MTTRYRSCPARAVWWLQEGQGYDTYTLACDAHRDALRADATTEEYRIPAEYPCCYLEPIKED